MTGPVRATYNARTGELPEDVPQVAGLMREDTPRPHAGWVALRWDGYGPRCSCGWRGRPTSSYKMAMRSHGQHRRKATA